jgi:hypothetical protein
VITGTKEMAAARFAVRSYDPVAGVELDVEEAVLSVFDSLLDSPFVSLLDSDLDSDLVFELDFVSLSLLESPPF